MCDVEFDGPNDFESEVTRKARKPHYCRECPRIIQPGETYTRHSHGYDGSVSSFKTCLRCDKVAETHSKAERSMGNRGAYYIGQLLSEVGECSRQHPEYVLAFRKAWKGEELPRYVRPDPNAGLYSTVMSPARLP